MHDNENKVRQRTNKFVAVYESEVHKIDSWAMRFLIDAIVEWCLSSHEQIFIAH